MHAARRIESGYMCNVSVCTEGEGESEEWGEKKWQKRESKGSDVGKTNAVGMECRGRRKHA